MQHKIKYVLRVFAALWWCIITRSALTIASYCYYDMFVDVRVEIGLSHAWSRSGVMLILSLSLLVCGFWAMNLTISIIHSLINWSTSE